MSSQGFWIHKLGLTLGAEVGGVDLSQKDSEAFHLLREALLDHLVIVVRDQQLEPDDFLALARRFGRVEPHLLTQYHHPRHREIMMLSNVIENGKPKGLADVGTYWHSDYSYRAIPAKETLLHALEVPQTGGDTLFANLYEAYSVMPDLLKRRVENLQAIHNYDSRHRQQIELNGINVQSTQERHEQTPDVVHPVVRTHPETRRPSLYVNPGFLVGFVGMNEAESEALKDVLFSYCLRTAFYYTHRWRVGDVVIWDNRCTMHCATGGYDADQRRTLMRCTVLGDKPYYIKG